jgi:hypothetical protein
MLEVKQVKGTATTLNVQNTTHTIHGITNAYKLNETNGASTVTKQSGYVSGSQTVYSCAELHISHANETTTAITDETYNDLKVSTTSTTPVEQSDTWDMDSALTFESDDALYMIIYYWAGAGAKSNVKSITCELQSSGLNDTILTWTIFIAKVYTNLPKVGWSTACQIKFGSGAVDSELQNLEINSLTAPSVSDADRDGDTAGQEAIDFSANWTAGDGSLDQYCLYTNASGSWTTDGDGWTSFSGTWSNITMGFDNTEEKPGLNGRSQRITQLDSKRGLRTTRSTCGSKRLRFQNISWLRLQEDSVGLETCTIMGQLGSTFTFCMLTATMIPGR